MTAGMTGPVHIRVPASSANLGPGYDSFGLALARFDEVTAERIESGLQITVEGIGAGLVPTDERHLVMQAALRAFDAMRVPVPGLRLHCVNRIPHGGGQGSSAAAIVAGILLARSLRPDGAPVLSDDEVFAIADDMEGHPDNVAPVLFGGFTVAWASGGSSGRHPRAVRLRPDPRIRAMVFTADQACATSQARAVLPAAIPHADAAANSARAALLVHALTRDPSLLLDATEDYLHQRYREGVMPETARLLRRLRDAGLAAVLSGAGPSVLVLGADLPDPAELAAPGFHAEIRDVPTTGAVVDGVPFGSGRADIDTMLHR
jgi:homoserine kinase